MVSNQQCYTDDESSQRRTLLQMIAVAIFGKISNSTTSAEKRCEQLVQDLKEFKDISPPRPCWKYDRGV